MLPWPISEIDIASHPPAPSYPGAPPLCRLDATYAGAGCVRVPRELRRLGEELQFGRHVSALPPVYTGGLSGGADRRFTSASASASVRVVPCKSRISAAGVTSSASASAAEVVTSGFLRLRTTAATAPPAAVSIEMPASLRQRRRGGVAGSSRCAAEDSRAEPLGAALSCRTCPVRSTCGAAQARVLCTRSIAAAPVLRASGFSRAATGLT